MEKLAEKAIKKALELQNKRRLSFKDIGEILRTQGVYLIGNNEGSVIYVGKAKVLRRRLKDDHVSGDNDGVTSTFRRKLCKTFGFKPGKELKSWIIKNCQFAWVEIPHGDETSLVEALLVYHYRSLGEKLLNT